MNGVAKAEELFNVGIRKLSGTFSDGSKRTLRLFRSTNGDVCYFGWRRKRYGSPLANLANLVSVSPIRSHKTEAQKWEDGWRKVITRLKASGLWGNLIPEIELALSVGLERLQEAYRRYWDISSSNESENEEFKAFAKNFPELIKVNDEGKPYISTSIVWTYHNPPKVKKMFFARKCMNDSILEDIQRAMDRKEKHILHRQYGYDVSFEYNPEKNKAWYSEEFRGCGNGHYYIALDATHALFMEDD